MPVVAKCPVHGTFPSRAYRFVNLDAAQLSGNLEQCPKCPRMARVMDGTYNFDKNGLATALAAPQWSRDALLEVQTPLQRLRSILEDPSVKEAAADKWIDRTARDIKAAPTLRAERKVIADEVIGAKGKSRKKKLLTVLIILDVLGHLVNVHGAYAITEEYVSGLITEAQASHGDSTKARPSHGDSTKARPSQSDSTKARPADYSVGVEDGPEVAEGSFIYGGKSYRLEERESERWRVFDGERYLGIVERADGTATREGPMYVAHAAGEESLPDVEPTDDWQRALEYLIEQSA